MRLAVTKIVIACYVQPLMLSPHKVQIQISITTSPSSNSFENKTNVLIGNLYAIVIVCEYISTDGMFGTLVCKPIFWTLVCFVGCARQPATEPSFNQVHVVAKQFPPRQVMLQCENRPRCGRPEPTSGPDSCNEWVVSRVFSHAVIGL